MNWCECDVYRVHGDINVSHVDAAGQLDANQTPVVYPDLNPSGDLEPKIDEPADTDSLLPQFEGTPELDSLILGDAAEVTKP